MECLEHVKRQNAILAKLDKLEATRAGLRSTFKLGFDRSRNRLLPVRVVPDHIPPKRVIVDLSCQ
jgi:hypothetical protein